MDTIHLGCSGCAERLTVEVEDDSGPWSEEDEARLMAAAEKAGWKARVEYGDSAYVYCPLHRDGIPVSADPGSLAGRILGL